MLTVPLLVMAWRPTVARSIWRLSSANSFCTELVAADVTPVATVGADDESDPPDTLNRLLAWLPTEADATALSDTVSVDCARLFPNWMPALLSELPELMTALA